MQLFICDNKQTKFTFLWFSSHLMMMTYSYYKLEVSLLLNYFIENVIFSYVNSISQVCLFMPCNWEAKTTEYTEWQRPLSAYIPSWWKNSTRLVRVVSAHVLSPPFILSLYLPSHTKLWYTLQLKERAYTVLSPYFYSTLLCTLWPGPGRTERGIYWNLCSKRVKQYCNFGGEGSSVSSEGMLFQLGMQQ